MALLSVCEEVNMSVTFNNLLSWETLVNNSYHKGQEKTKNKTMVWMWWVWTAGRPSDELKKEALQSQEDMKIWVIIFGKSSLPKLIYKSPKEQNNNNKNYLFVSLKTTDCI